jgi:hypothetical protein
VDRTAGNEILTSTTAVVLTILLAVEGITLLTLDSTLSLHMFIGLLLVPPVLLKLASTGYRFVRYYTRSPAYLEKGPPLIWLRLLAPVLVVTTVIVLASGIALMVVGHRSGTMLQIHKVSFVVWGATFAVHFLAYLPRALRALRHAGVPGARRRIGLVLGSLAAGVVLAVASLPVISDFHRLRF